MDSAPRLLQTGSIDLRESVLPAMISLRGPAGDAAFRQAAEAAFGVALPVTANRFTGSDRRALWLGPDEWLLLAPLAELTAIARSLDDALAPFHHAVTDVTGNRIVFELSGSGARTLLSMGCSLDLGPDGFGPGHCVQTLLARAGVTLLQGGSDDRFEIQVRRSFADYLWAWLTNACGVLSHD
jgi:sarcosine oxidase subunit gamma